MENYEFFHERELADKISGKWYCQKDHSKNWKIFRSGIEVIFYYIPATAIFSCSVADLSGFSRKDGSDCLFCKFEEETPCSEKPDPVVKIKAIALNVIEQCNMRCGYCFAGEGDYGFTSKMSFETAKRAVSFFARGSDSLHIIFFGGEPLLNFSLIRSVVRWCQNQKGVRFTFGITTNGLLLTEKTLDFFNRHQFRVKVSYDGPHLHGHQRKTVGATRDAVPKDILAGKIHRLAKGLRQLRGLKLRATLSREMLRLVYDNFLALLNSFEYRIAYARVSSSKPELKFTREDIQKISLILSQLTDYLLEKKDYPALMRFYPLKTYIIVFHRGEFHRNFCGAGLDYLSVSTTGGFYLCHRFTEDQEESLGSLDTGWNHRKLAEVSRIRSGKEAPCNQCWMRQICAGGCFHEHKMGRGTISTVDPVFCQLQEAEMRQALKAYLEIRRHAPELFDR